MYKKRLHKFTIIIYSLFCMMILSSCEQPKVEETVQQGGFVKIAPGAYDSQDTAIVVAKQEKQKKITLLNLAKKKNYTLNYDGITKFKDKYGTLISVSQLQEGEMVATSLSQDDA